MGPLSTTHCQVGATAGVSLLEGFKGCNGFVLAKCAFGWVITCVFVGFVAAIFFALGAYAPMASETGLTAQCLGMVEDTSSRACDLVNGISPHLYFVVAPFSCS